MTWSGRQLTQMSMAGGQQLYQFTYNADGIRTSKVSQGTEHKYTLNGSQIVAEEWGTHLLIYLYDESGAPIGLQYRNSTYDKYVFDTYYFEKNLQGDVVAVYDAKGNRIGSYTYDAWGNVTVSYASGATTAEKRIVRNYNPFRYRGYYYDIETGLYYLQSRYYDPAMGRFINADGYVSTATGLMGYNMYAYCNNNPVMLVDETGQFPWLIAVAIVVVCLSLTSCNNSSPPVSEDARIYDVPLYKQSNSDECGLYCQAMADAYINQADYEDGGKSRVNELKNAVDDGQPVYGGTEPTNKKTMYGINNIMDLYNLLEDGPVYARYSDSYGAHMVLVTGVDYQNNVVYTNNPWGYSGTQTFNEFLDGVYCKFPHSSGTLKFEAVYTIKWEE